VADEVKTSTFSIDMPFESNKVIAKA